LATTLYNLKANEKELAKNVVASLETLKNFFKQSLDSLTNELPVLAKAVAESAQTRVYGVDLGLHLRIDGNVDGLALPLRLGVNGLKHNMKEEGLFRIGPSIPIFNKLKALIDAGADENAILGHFKDPHLYTAMIKTLTSTRP